MATMTYNGRKFTTGDTIYFTKYWQNTYNTAAAGVYSGQYSFYATVSELYDTSNNRTHNVKFTGLHNTSGTITGGGGYCTPSEVTKGFQVTVTYNRNGGSSGTSSQTGYVGASLTGTAARSGYQFAGWYTASSGGSKVTTIPANTAIYYAHWTGNTFYVKFNGNGNTGGSTAQETFTYGTAKALTANGFTRTGYTFSKWNTNTSGTGTNYTNKQSVSNLTTTNKGTVNLYAVWTANSYSVHFDGNGALSGTMSDESFTYDSAQALTANGFSKGLAYGFAGWNTQPDGSGTTYTDGQSVSNLTSTANGVVTLYAQWELQYLKPTIENLTALRYENGAEADEGTCVHVAFSWYVDTVVSSENFATSVKVEYKEHDANTWTTLVNTQYSEQTQASIGGDYSYTSSSGVADADTTYDIRVSITDNYGTNVLDPPITAPQAEDTTFLSQAFFTIDWAVGGKGIGVGRPAPSNGLAVKMASTFDTSVDTTIKYDDDEEEYYDGLNDEALLSPNTISKIELALGLPPTTWDYNPWWTDPASPISLYNVLDALTIKEATVSVTATKGSVESAYMYKLGHIVFFYFAVRAASAISAGANVFEGTLNNNIPIHRVTGAAYNGSKSIIGAISSETGAIIIRNSSASELSNNSTVGMSFTYFTED